MADDKKPIPRARLVQLLTPAKKKEISVEKPSLASVSASGGEPKPKQPKTYKEPIPTAIKSSTAVRDLALKAEQDKSVEKTFDNTVKYVAESMGAPSIKPGTNAYEAIRSSLAEQKKNGGLTVTQDDKGNPIYGTTQSYIKDFKDSFNEYDVIKKKGEDYALGSENENINKLEAARLKSPSQQLPVVRNPVMDILGKMTIPLAQGVTGAVAGTAVAGPYGTIPGFLTGVGATFALSAPDGIAMKYGESLEENYIKARNQGMDKTEAYEAANSAAMAAAGGEAVMQGFYATMGGGPKLAKPIFNQAKKEAVGKVLAKTAVSAGEKLREPLAVGAAAAASQTIADLEAKQQGIEVEDMDSRAISAGSDFFLLDASVKALSKLVTAPKYIKAAMANMMSDADKQVTKQFIAEGENQGIYPKGTAKKVNQAVDDFKNAKEQSPKFDGDVQRETVVAGLTQKLNGLVEEQSKLADIHKADLQPKIDDVKKRIEIAKTAENPLEAEFNDDGTPLIKTQEYATKTTEGEVKEGVPESRVSEYQGTEEVKPVEATVQTEAAKTDIGNRPVSGEETKVTPSAEPKSKQARGKAETEMEGIKSDDYAELERVASELYGKKEIEDVDVMAKRLRDYQEQKGDTSAIPDSVFNKIATDTKSPDFKPTVKEPTAKKIRFDFEAESEPLRVTARDAFRGMYMAAENVGKSIKNRVSLAAKSVKDALKGTGLDLDEVALTKSIGKFVSSKMDDETAIQTFMDNLDEIVGEATFTVEKATARNSIKSIQKNAKSPGYSTVAIKETVAGVDWISPSKIDPEKIGEYNALLEDFNKSITGQIPESATIRQDLINFTNQQREWYNNRKSERFGKKYDNLVKKGEIDPAIVSREEYVFWNMEPEAQVRPEAEAALIKLDDSEAVVMRDMTTARQELLGEYINSDEMNPEYRAAAEEVKNFDVNKVNPKNVKLLNNIIEDIMSGERPSRIGEIATDIGKFDAIEAMKKERVRSVAGIKTAGIGKIRRLFGWEGDVDNYKKFGMTNTLRQIGFNEKSRAVFRSAILGKFPERIYSFVTGKSKDAAEGIYDIFSKDKVGNVKFKSPRLVELNDYRIGMVAILRQFDELYPNLETVKNSLITLSRISKDNIGEYKDYVNRSIDALKSLDLIDNITEVDGVVEDITFKQGKNSNDLVLQLNDRELAAYEFAKRNFSDLAPTLDNTVRDVYGVSLDLTNTEYLPLATFFTGDNKVVDLEDSPFGGMPSLVRSMRSGTTFDRQPSLVGKTTKGGKDVAVHYDFRFMKNFLSKYHESLTTAYTAREVKQIAKIINSKDFRDIMSGAFNVEPKIYNDNAGVVNDVIQTYVNGIRSPYNLSSAQIKERNGWSKFLYGKLLYGYSQVFKQTIPSYAYLLTEANGNPLPFINSHKIIGKAVVDGDTKDALKAFLNSTSQTDRVAGGLEIFHKEIADLDASDFNRAVKNINNATTNFFSTPFNIGDKYTTINSLLIGYMNGLKKFGKLKSFSDFDIIAEAKNGFDTQALAYAENFMSQVNSESAAYTKAEVLRRSDAPVTRMLQSFALNQWANFQVDMGVATDKYATSSDRKEALKRVMQYIGVNTMYATVSGYLANMNLRAAKSILNMTDVQQAEVTEDTKQSEKEKEKLTYLRSFLGTGMEMTLGGTGLLASQGIKAAASLSLEAIKKHYREQDEKMGIPTKGTLVSPEFNFIYRNNSLGVNGAFFDDIEKAYNGVFKEGDQRVESQRQSQKMIDAAILFGTLIPPTPDIANMGMYMSRALKSRSIDRKEYLASIWYEKTVAQTPYDREYWEGVYANETKDIKNIAIVEQKTLIPLADKLYRQEVIRQSAKKFDRPNYKVSDVLYNMSTKFGEPMFKILNNRYIGQDINNNEELRFLVQMGGLSPEDYALSVGMDKDGKPMIGFDFQSNWENIQNRYIEADRIAPTNKIYKHPGTVGSVNELVELYAKYANRQALYEDIKK